MRVLTHLIASNGGLLHTPFQLEDAFAGLQNMSPVSPNVRQSLRV